MRKSPQKSYAIYMQDSFCKIEKLCQLEGFSNIHRIDYKSSDLFQTLIKNLHEHS
jgi:hypothetical protein